MKILSIIGARPQFIKVSPIVEQTRRQRINHVLVHTGQHYDYEMSRLFFDQLGIPKPKYQLNVGSGNHGQQTGLMLERIEKTLLRERPDWVIVYGDTNTTLAGALAAAKLHIPLAHVESGLRSFNREMPEEINRVLTDHCSNLLFCPTRNAAVNLKREGFLNVINKGTLIKPDLKLSREDRPFAVVNVGDIMYDAFLLSLRCSETKSSILEKHKLSAGDYYLATIHRCENTDHPGTLKEITAALLEISKKRPVIFPIHPRTRRKLQQSQIKVKSSQRLKIIDPIGYFDMLILEKNARAILTDSGGIQKEAYFLNIPCLVLRQETEWPETVTCGMNIIAGTKTQDILKSMSKLPHTGRKNSSQPFGDGKASQRIINLLKLSR